MAPSACRRFLSQPFDAPSGQRTQVDESIFDRFIERDTQRRQDIPKRLRTDVGSGRHPILDMAARQFGKGEPTKDGNDVAGNDLVVQQASNLLRTRPNAIRAIPSSQSVEGSGVSIEKSPEKLRDARTKSSGKGPPVALVLSR